MKVWLILAAVSMMACSPQMSADTSNSPVLAANAASSEGLGAWVSVDPFSPNVQEAARFAVQTLAVQNKQRLLFKDVSQARQQQVAGLQLELSLQVTLDGNQRQAKAFVWRTSDGVYKLQSWTWLD
jgi:hypothetical protein